MNNRQNKQRNKQQNKPDTRYWDQRRGSIRSRKGGIVIGQDAFSHGHSILHDLLGRASYMQVQYLNIVGRPASAALAAWLEGFHICMSYPDARLWCNQIGALAGTLRASPVAGVLAGTWASDSRMYGPGVFPAVFEFLRAAHDLRAQGCALSEVLASKPLAARVRSGPPGYDRPLAAVDERVAVMAALERRLQLSPGRYAALARAIEAELQRRSGQVMNLAAYAVAFLMDQGLSCAPMCRLVALLVNSGVAACYAEAYDEPPEAFLPLRCEDVRYTGVQARPVPDPQDCGL